MNRLDTKHIYIHIPFCKSICYYCDFNKVSYNQDLADKYINTIEIEIRKIIEEIKNKQASSPITIYIGGGTPSVLNNSQLFKLLSLFNNQVFNTVKEFTIEVNPETLDLDKIKIIAQSKVNRISIGVQSHDATLLKLINRKHSFEDVCKCISLFNEYGIDNISVDLMYSLPSQSIDILKQSITSILKLNIKHISIYSLTIEPNTVFEKLGYQSLDSDIEADMYELIIEELSKEGFIQYEVSNFCINGYQSKHNIAYWKYLDFLGIGAGASGKCNGVRYTNINNIQSYIQNTKQYQEDIILTKEGEIFEHLMMNLRLLSGLDICDFNKIYNIEFMKKFKNAILKNRDNLVIKNNYLKLKNIALLNNVLLDFMNFD